jgi:HPt (histidine-containing phosphotransfer) domain-containing protein
MGVSGLAANTGSEQPAGIIDEAHLQQMTLGDSRLEREVLEIFVRQTVIMLDRIAGAERSLAAATAHTLMGSARGIGAWRVAGAAERLEHIASGPGSAAALRAAVAELRAATLEASRAIGARLELGRGH